MPVPQTETRRSRGQASKTASVNLEEERMLSTTSASRDAFDQALFRARQRVVIVQLCTGLQVGPCAWSPAPEGRRRECKFAS